MFNDLIFPLWLREAVAG